VLLLFCARGGARAFVFVNRRAGVVYQFLKREVLGVSASAVSVSRWLGACCVELEACKASLSCNRRRGDLQKVR